MSIKKNSFLLKGLLKTDKYDYVITVNTSQLTKNDKQVIYSRYFNLGSYISNTDDKRKSCVDIYVMYPDSVEELPFSNYKIAKLITTHYNEKCSVNEKLERGDGTKHMINTAMYFVSRVCPHVEGFEINDASTRECDNNTIISLSYFSLTNYGKTWYEKNFNAYIGDTVKRNKYRQIIDTFLNKSLPAWDFFNVMFLKELNNDMKNELEVLYNKSSTYEDFFKNIHKMGISSACIYLQPWIDRLMMSTDLRNYILYTQWIIPITSLKKIPLVNYRKDFSGKLENYKD